MLRLKLFVLLNLYYIVVYDIYYYENL